MQPTRDRVNPEKTDTTPLRRPPWIRVRAPSGEVYEQLQTLMRQKSLHTVCEEAGCPNIGECWEKKHATFMIMGDTCTRACAFCNVKTGLPQPLDPEEPGKVGLAVAQLGLNHVVITSVDRDDLADGGARHFAEVIGALRAACPTTTIEVLTPDFLRKDGAAEVMIDATPDVFNHNLETVPRLYLKIRPGARYYNSLRLLDRVKQRDPSQFTKSGLMVGLGETDDEILEVMRDMRAHNVEMLTIGQYLQPSGGHLPVLRYVHPDVFKMYETEALKLGFRNAACGPMVRSSYWADQQAQGAGVTL